MRHEHSLEEIKGESSLAADGLRQSLSNVIEHVEAVSGWHSEMDETQSAIRRVLQMENTTGASGRKQ